MSEAGTIGEEFEEDLTDIEMVQDEAIEENVSRETMSFDFVDKIKAFFLTPESNTPLEDYEDSPINWNSKKSGQHGARFIEAFTGSLRLAIFDLIKCIYYLSEEKKSGGAIHETEEL